MMKTDIHKIKTEQAWNRLYDRLDKDHLLVEDHRMPKIPMWVRYGTVAAMVVGLVFSTLYWGFGQKEELPDFITQENQDVPTLVTTLEDGSVVFLAKETFIRYPEHFVSDKREVSLQGDAFFDVAKKQVAEKYNREIRNPYDLEPEEEALIGQYYKEECDADFVFVTHYPSKKRPFYAMDDPEDPTYTLSFDLLFRGMEITTGGQRIHDYHELLAKMEKRGMTDEGMEQYLSAFKHGMPPHGGLGIGMERLTMKMMNEDNVRETTLFPRDLSRLEP